MQNKQQTVNQKFSASESVSQGTVIQNKLSGLWVIPRNHNTKKIHTKHYGVWVHDYVYHSRLFILPRGTHRDGRPILRYRPVIQLERKPPPHNLPRTKGQP